MDRCYAARLPFNKIPAGFNPLRQRLRGECPAGISNGVYFHIHQTFSQLIQSDLYATRG